MWREYSVEGHYDAVWLTRALVYSKPRTEVSFRRLHGNWGNISKVANYPLAEPG